MNINIEYSQQNIHHFIRPIATPYSTAIILSSYLINRFIYCIVGQSLHRTPMIGESIPHSKSMSIRLLFWCIYLAYTAIKNLFRYIPWIFINRESNKNKYAFGMREQNPLVLKKWLHLQKSIDATIKVKANITSLKTYFDLENLMKVNEKIHLSSILFFHSLKMNRKHRCTKLASKHHNNVSPRFN